uniref:Uncharacterized protein n=1 Tax=Rhizophora mucronata TaxID=61149 RepID=A0A2P2IPI2_RHIMU
MLQQQSRAPPKFQAPPKTVTSVTICNVKAPIFIPSAFINFFAQGLGFGLRTRREEK